MKTSLCPLLACGTLLFTLCATASTPHWNQFRGPNGDGKTTANLPLRFSETENVKWKTPMPGKAWSSPVIWENAIWITNAEEDGHQLWAISLDASTGDIQHNKLVFENETPQFCYPMNSYATPTPFVEEGRVYVHFGVHGTACLDTGTGKTLWERRDLECNHHRGPAASPIIYNDLLIVQFDGFDVQFVIALDKKTGATRWRHDRAYDYKTTNGDLKKAYCTPQVIHHDGRAQLIAPGAVATESLDPLTGDLIWTARTGGMNASARPIFGQGLVFVVNGMGSMSAIRPDGRGDVTDTHIEWGSRRSVPKKSSLILHDDLLFMTTDGGVASCVAPKTGEVFWAERLSGGEYAASPIYSQGRVFFFSERGEVDVVAAGREFKPLANTEFPEGFMATPAVIGNDLILRSRNALYRVGE